MSDVYENCPAFENDKFLLRFSQLDDAEDLVSVYSDKNALPFFNSDNCHGDNFYYPNEDRMRQVLIDCNLIFQHVQQISIFQTTNISKMQFILQTRITPVDIQQRV